MSRKANILDRVPRKPLTGEERRSITMTRNDWICLQAMIIMTQMRAQRKRKNRQLWDGIEQRLDGIRKKLNKAINR